MIIMGIDPGLANIGYGIVEFDGQRSVLRHMGVATTKSDTPLAQRLVHIHDAIRAESARWKPDVIAVEQLFFAANTKSAMAVAEARGVAIFAACSVTGTPLVEFTPLQIKMAIAGNGRASKLQVQQMVKILLGLPEIPRPDHAADALACALSHAHTSRFANAVAIAAPTVAWRPASRRRRR